MKKTIIAILLAAAFLLPTLVSCNSEKTANGKSAYEIAVENGFSGSEAEWLDSLKGKDGEDGKDGVDGKSGKDGKDGVAGADGKDGVNGENGKDGQNGTDGIGIKETKINENGFLIVTLTNGTVINAGYVGIAKEDTSDKAPILNVTSLNIPEGKPYLLTSDRPDTVFKSSDPSVVQVSPEGLILALSEGNATVTATARDGKETVCNVSVLCYDFIKLNDGTLEITGYYGTQKALDIPSNIMGKAVTSIGNSAFADWEEKLGYTSVTIPDSVTDIGDYAFNSLTELTSVTFGKNVKSIGNSAFSGCKKLEEISLPDSLTYLGGAAFNVCESLTSIKIPNSITEIKGSTFEDCKNLTSVDLGSGVKYIGMFAFGYCAKLESIILPTNVIELEEYAFAYCTALKSVEIGNSVLYYENTFKSTPWFAENGGIGNNPSIIPDSEFEERDETVYVYATFGDNDEHDPDLDVRAYMYPYTSGWATKDNEYALKNYTEYKRVGIYVDDSGYGWSKLEFTNGSGEKIYIYVRTSQLVTKLPDNVTA